MSQLNKIFCAVAFFFPVTVTAAAQEWRGGGETVRVGFEEQRIGGSLVGCDLSFTQSFRDDLYRQGAPGFLHGLIGLLKPTPQVLAFSLKVVGEDQGATPGQASTLFSPSFAYVSAGGYSSAHHEHEIFQCEGPGFCASYGGDADTSGMLGVALSSTFTVAFQRRPGALDFPVVVHLTPDGSPVSPANLLFVKCARELAKSLTD